MNQFADLRSTVRYIGRVLGDVIRGQDGEALFDRIEAIRKASVEVGDCSEFAPEITGFGERAANAHPEPGDIP